MEIQTAVGSDSAPPWIELPEDVTANILQRLGTVEILESAQKVCTTWRRVCQDSAMWRVIHLYSPRRRTTQSAMCGLARRAVDLSRGELIDLRIVNYGDDELLDYIVDRSSNLRRLTLDRCDMMLGTALAESVKKLPHLEELHLFNMQSYKLEAEDVAAIGVSCPALKSFSFVEEFRGPVYGDDSTDGEFGGVFERNAYALAIARTMPNLVRLSVSIPWMKSKGLEAILDGCRRLESLDVRGCCNLDLRGDLGERCSQQIKYLQWEECL